MDTGNVLYDTDRAFLSVCLSVQRRYCVETVANFFSPCAIGLNAVTNHDNTR